MGETPKLGLFAVNMRPTVEPEAAAWLGRLAEELGYESLWAGEHVVLPDPQRLPSPMPPTEPILDPLVSLTFLAAQTTRLRLGTGIIVLPQRNPVVLAKELASLDVLSGGRLLFGMGVGYLEPELAAAGVPMQDRGRRAEEYLEAMHALWTMTSPSYSGRFVSFSGVNAYPRPAQEPKDDRARRHEERPHYHCQTRSGSGHWKGCRPGERQRGVRESAFCCRQQHALTGAPGGWCWTQTGRCEVANDECRRARSVT